MKIMRLNGINILKDALGNYELKYVLNFHFFRLLWCLSLNAFSNFKVTNSHIFYDIANLKISERALL